MVTLQQSALFRIRECPVPIEVRTCPWQPAAFQKSLEPVLKTDLAVGDRPAAGGLLHHLKQSAGEAPHEARIAVGAIGQITAEQLVATLAAERHRHLLLG